MKDYYETSLRRFEELIRRRIEIDNQHKDLDLEKGKVEHDIEAFKGQIQTGLDDPAVKAEFRRISEIKKELAVGGRPSRTPGPNKTHVIIQILQKHGQQGMTIVDIMELLPTYGLDVDRNYLNSILGKLKKRGMVTKQGNKFFLTQPARNAKTAANAAGQGQ